MKSLSRGLSLLALLAWGTLMLYFYFSGRLASGYLIPAYRPLVLVAGALMLLIAAVLAFSHFFGARWQLAEGAAVEDCPDDFASPGRVRATQILSFALLVAPIWAAAAVSKDQFSASAMINRGITTNASLLPAKSAASAATAPVYEPPLPGATAAAAPDSALDASQYLKKSAAGNVLLEVTDLLFAAEDDAMRPALENKTVEMIGQYMPLSNGNVSGNRFQLARMFMVCCSADARPVAVAVEAPKTTAAAKPVEMAWTRVIGKVSFPMENGRRQAVVEAQSLAPSDPPSEAMLY